MGFRVLPLSTLYCLDEAFYWLLGASYLLQNRAKIEFCPLFVLLQRDLWQTFLCVSFVRKWRVNGIILSFQTAYMRL